MTGTVHQDSPARGAGALRYCRIGAVVRRYGVTFLAALLFFAMNTIASQNTAPLFLVDTPFDPPMISRIFLLDPLSGDMALKADLGTEWSPVFGLAAASETVLYATGTDTSGTLCASDGCLLLRIELDPNSTVPLSITEIGAVEASSQVIGKVTGLSFRNTGVLYAIGQETDGLYTLDVTTAQAQLIGTVDVDIHGGDITFSDDDRLFLWTNLGAASGLYELDPDTAQASAFDLQPGLSFAGLAALGHREMLYGATPPADRLHEIDVVTGFTGMEFSLTLDNMPFDHKRGDLDSPFCASDTACDDSEVCTGDACTPGGCAYLDLDLGQISCGVGECARIVPICLGGSSQSCTPGNPSAERCDGVDNDCDGFIDNNIAAAGPAPDLNIEVLAPDDLLVWNEVSAETGYNVIRGDAGTLHQTGGDFAQAVSACLAAGEASTSISGPVQPPPDTIFWYLVEPTSCSGGPGYDTLGQGQSAPRNAAIAAAASSCP
jgi:hypothetical protein